jgi:Nucleotidyl transferase AbiEii toxin, Type IV TA system
MSHRLALDHVLALVAGAPCGESLVLRGSMTMLAWVGDRARPPGDLDWVVRPVAGVPVDDLDPYPFVDGLDTVQSSPEAAHGAGRYRIWDFEEFDTGGFAPRLPPEGLHWMTAEELNPYDSPHLDVLSVVGRDRRTPDGIVFDPEAAAVDATWGYDYGRDSTSPGGGGVRVTLPWRSPDEAGSIQLDFAYDERLPAPPVFVAVPRVNGGTATVVRSVSRELSLAWKLQWMATDLTRDGRVAGKDLYDAVLLAELPRLRLPDRLRRIMLRAVPSPQAVAGWEVDWSAVSRHATRDPQAWLDRLARALHRVLTPQPFGQS